MINNKGEDEESGNFTNIWYSNFLLEMPLSGVYKVLGRRDNVIIDFELNSNKFLVLTIWLRIWVLAFWLLLECTDICRNLFSRQIKNIVLIRMILWNPTNEFKKVSWKWQNVCSWISPYNFKNFTGLINSQKTNTSLLRFQKVSFEIFVISCNKNIIIMIC